MKNIKYSMPYKVVCFLLTCLLFGGAVSIAAAGFIEGEQLSVVYSSYYRSVYGNDYLAASDEAWESRRLVGQLYCYYIMEQQGIELNESQQYKRDKAVEALRSKNTNYYYRIVDLEGKTIFSNLSDGEDITKLVSKRYYSPLSKDGVFNLDGYSAYSVSSWTLNDLIDARFFYDEEEKAYISIEQDNEYQSELARYQDTVNNNSISEETASNLNAIRRDLDGYFDTKGTFWHYNDEKDEFVAVSVKTSGGEQSGDIQYFDETSGGYILAESYMDENHHVFYHVEEGGYAESTVSGLEAVAESTEPESSMPTDNRDRLTAMLEWGIADAVWEGKGVNDAYQQTYWGVTSFEEHLPWYIGMTALCSVLCIVFFVMLLCAIGHDQTGAIVLTPIHKLPADLLLCGLGLAVCAPVILGIELLEYYYGWWTAESTPLDSVLTLSDWLSGQSMTAYEIVFLAAAVAMAIVLPFFTTVTAQLKNRSLIRHSFIGWCLHLTKQLLAWLAGGVKTILSVMTSTYWFLPLGYLLFHLILGVLTMEANETASALLLAFVMIGTGLLLLCVYVYGWQKAQTAAQKLADGDLLHQTSTEKTYFAQKKHIENLNSISEGMQKAIEEQLKSEHFRTELITNVSHDLKTPLTSIINYVDLLKKRNIQDEAAQNYIAILEQKSQRLKTLTEDLVEASKAAAGVLNVNTERLDAGQLIQQAVGEYEERLSKAGLTVVKEIPDTPVYVQADGRHLWRILDNLLSNCAKYAMPNTRVYVLLEQRNGEAVISVKNISAEPLNIPAEELMERFVRGDSSRTNEGSGLGLSIAQSLAKLQNADFCISTDGDLFKAQLTLKIHNS